MQNVAYWNPLNIIFFLLILYFTLLSFFSFYRTYITIKGLFWGLTITLAMLLSILLFNFHNIFISQMVFTWELFLVKPSWAFPDISISLYFDVLSYLFIFLVCIIGCATNFYILNYFKYEANEDIFILLINWFILSMILLVISNNFFTLFLGWELIGLTSFFLINFWNERRGTLKSSFKAFVFNKISDFYLFIFIILLWFLTGKSSIHLINAEISLNLLSVDIYWFIAGVSLILCSSIKSAQLIGHLWLPDSMEAPVPASALIHSATLVSAGIYLLLRFNPLINFLQLNNIILVLGSITAAYGGVVASSQTDVKKLLAYSTISHCGFLFVCTSLQNYYLTIIYLFLHGLFKAMTFFCVGTFIRVSGSQDTRQMGILNRYIPVDTIYLIICAGNLGGLPFTLGYLYKNLFLNILVNSYLTMLSLGLCFIGMLSSIVYVYRLVYYAAFDYNKGNVNLSLKLLQDNPNLEKNYWSASTLIQSIIILLLLFLTLYIYIIFITYLNLSNLILDMFPIVFNSDIHLIKENSYIYNYYINFFYMLYSLVVIIMIILECKKSYSWQRKLHFLIYFILFFFLIIFFF